LYSLGRQDQDAALAEYAEARKLCDEHRIPQAEIDRLFSPKIPVRLPAFFKNPLVTREVGAKGHIDVGFEVDKYGHSNRVRTKATAGNAPVELQRSLERAIKGLRFRPQLIHGELADTGPIVVRYHVGAAGPPPTSEQRDPVEPIPAFPRGQE
jgi:hypothetical protein